MTVLHVTGDIVVHEPEDIFAVLQHPTTGVAVVIRRQEFLGCSEWEKGEVERRAILEVERRVAEVTKTPPRSAQTMVSQRCRECRVPLGDSVQCIACARARNINEKINSLHWIASGTFVLVAASAFAAVVMWATR